MTLGPRCTLSLAHIKNCTVAIETKNAFPAIDINNKIWRNNYHKHATVRNVNTSKFHNDDKMKND